WARTNSSVPTQKFANKCFGARRPAGQARRPRILSVFEEGATQPVVFPTRARSAGVHPARRPPHAAPAPSTRHQARSTLHGPCLIPSDARRHSLPRPHAGPEREPELPRLGGLLRGQRVRAAPRPRL